ncbi:outer membrane beta-barrel protein [Helicobacter bizzozeronii]|uniref:outer membrane beta-barrel protein n=1 Tax=Helicobacter bizzozeronii TaxID=56877 RepID=UPI000CF03872|nr:outer membrane beta-barrel protein [Helicobacter bizzozeronii]
MRSKGFLNWVLGMGALVGGLQAEQSAAFVGVMYEVGASTFKARLHGQDLSKGPSRSAITQGVGVHVGYNQLFGQKGWIGLRYYGFYNWGLTNFGNFVSNNNINFGKNTFNLSGYGVGLDLLLNLFTGDNFNLGVFGGVAVGGNTWTASQVNKTQFQWMVNAGVRLVIARHSAIQFGVKIPMMRASYASHPNGTEFYNTDIYLKRDWAFTAAYYFLF